MNSWRCPLSKRCLTTFPRKHVHCVFDNLQDAVLAYRILLEAGYDEKNIHLLANKDYVEAVEQGQTLISFLASIDLDVYLQEARRGHPDPRGASLPV